MFNESGQVPTDCVRNPNYIALLINNCVGENSGQSLVLTLNQIDEGVETGEERHPQREDPVVKSQEPVSPIRCSRANQRIAWDGNHGTQALDASAKKGHQNKQGEEK